MQLDQFKRPGFRIREYFVSFPEEGDFIIENEDGTMSIMVDIFKIDDYNNLHPLEKGTNTDELQPEIEAWVNAALENALEMAKHDLEKAEKNK